MMRKWSSFVAKNCRSRRSSGFFLQSRRGFSSSASHDEEGSWVPPVIFMSSLAGFAGYMIDDFLNAKKSRKKLRKIEEEADYFHKVFMEKQDEYKKLSKEIFGTN